MSLARSFVRMSIPARHPRQPDKLTKGQNDILATTFQRNDCNFAVRGPCALTLSPGRSYNLNVRTGAGAWGVVRASAARSSQGLGPAHGARTAGPQNSPEIQGGLGGSCIRRRPSERDSLSRSGFPDPAAPRARTAGRTTLGRLRPKSEPSAEVASVPSPSLQERGDTQGQLTTRRGSILRSSWRDRLNPVVSQLFRLVCWCVRGRWKGRPRPGSPSSTLEAESGSVSTPDALRTQLEPRVGTGAPGQAR